MAIAVVTTAAALLGTVAASASAQAAPAAADAVGAVESTTSAADAGAPVDTGAVPATDVEAVATEAANATAAVDASTAMTAQVAPADDVEGTVQSVATTVTSRHAVSEVEATAAGTVEKVGATADSAVGDVEGAVDRAVGHVEATTRHAVGASGDSARAVAGQSVGTATGSPAQAPTPVGEPDGRQTRWPAGLGPVSRPVATHAAALRTAPELARPHTRMTAERRLYALSAPMPLAATTLSGTDGTAAIEAATRPAPDLPGSSAHGFASAAGPSAAPAFALVPMVALAVPGLLLLFLRAQALLRPVAFSALLERPG